MNSRKSRGDGYIDRSKRHNSYDDNDESNNGLNQNNIKSEMGIHESLVGNNLPERKGTGLTSLKSGSYSSDTVKSSFSPPSISASVERPNFSEKEKKANIPDEDGDDGNTGDGGGFIPSFLEPGRQGRRRR